MTIVNPAIRRFLEAFEQNNSTRDFSAVAAQFADVFMAANPQGVQTVKASDFALALPKRKQLFDGLGSRSTSLTRIDVTELAPRFYLAKTEWTMTFDRGAELSKEILVRSSFIVHGEGDNLRIIFYLASQDILAVLKEHGILQG